MKNNFLGLPTRTASVILLLFLGAGVAYTYLWPNAPVTSNDSAEYMKTARDLADGQLDELSQRAPGLPVLLYLTDSHISPSKSFWYAQLLLYYLSLWLLCVVLRSLRFGVKTIGLFIAIMLLPPNVENAGYLLSENLAQFWLVGMFFCFIKWIRTRHFLYAAGAGIAVSFAALTRPTYQALPFVIVACLVAWLFYLRRSHHNKDFGPAVLGYLSVFILIVGAFSYLNYVKFAYFGITPLLGYNLSTKTTRFVEELPEDQYGEFRKYLIEARDKELISGSSHTGNQYIWSLGPDEIEKKLDMSKPDAARYMLNLNLDLILRSPMGYLVSVLEAASRYWLPSTSNLANMGSKRLQLLWIIVQLLIMFMFFFQLIVLFGSKVFELSKRISLRPLRPKGGPNANMDLVVAHTLPLVIVFYTFAISCLIDVGSSRQRSGDALLIFATIVGYRLWFNRLTMDTRPNLSLDHE